MRNLIILALSGTLFYAPARAEVLYVRPDNGSLTAQYSWHDEVIRAAIPVKTAIAVAKTANGSRPIEMRLLRREGADETSIPSISAATDLL
jgi:hypothetical protein